jgi:hypothetical protein
VNADVSPEEDLMWKFDQLNSHDQACLTVYSVLAASFAMALDLWACEIGQRTETNGEPIMEN